MSSRRRAAPGPALLGPLPLRGVLARRRRLPARGGVGGPAPRGFTLLEVLLAATLAAVVGLALASILSVMNTAQERVRTRSERRALLSALERRIAADLRALVPPGGLHAAGLVGENHASTGGSHPLLDATLERALLETSAGDRWLTWLDADLEPPLDGRARLVLAVNPPPPAFGQEVPFGEGGLWEVVYELDDDPATEEWGLVRRVTRVRDPVPGAEPEPVEVLAPWVVGFELAFFDGIDWQEGWDSGASDLLPVAVEMRLAVAWPDELILHRILVAPAAARPSFPLPEAPGLGERE